MAEGRARRDRGEGVVRARRCRGEAKASLDESERRPKPRPRLIRSRGEEMAR